MFQFILIDQEKKGGIWREGGNGENGINDS